MAGIVEPYYPKAGNGRQPYALMAMPRIYCRQLWYKLSDPAMEDWLYAVTPARRLAGLELARMRFRMRPPFSIFVTCRTGTGCKSSSLS